MILVARQTSGRLGIGQQLITLAEADRLRRAGAGTGGGGFAFGTAVRAQVALHRVMPLGIVTHGAVRTGDDALATTSAARFIDTHDPRHRILGNRFRVDRADTQAGRPLAVLTGQRQEGEAGLFQRTGPYHLVAVFAGAETVFGLARRFTALAAGAALKVDQQRNAFGRFGIHTIHISLPMPANATR